MAKDTGPSAVSTPTSAPPPSKKSTSSTQNMKNQKTLHGFFSKTPTPGSASSTLPGRSAAPRSHASLQGRLLNMTPSTQFTPAPSSDGPEEQENSSVPVKVKPPSKSRKDLPCPVSSADGRVDGQRIAEADNFAADGTPSRKAKYKEINYAESDSEGAEDLDDVFKPAPKVTRAPPNKRRKVSESADEEVYQQEDSFNDDDLDDFIVADDSESDVPRPMKRKQPSNVPSRVPSSTRAPGGEGEELNLELPETSTTQQWSYDPENPQPLQPRPANIQSKKPDSAGSKYKKKVHMTEPDQRYAWLADIRDIDRNPLGHPDYDPRTLYIPPLAFAKFSPFEKQYWEIKQKFWDTIVFFKKGKFYELYENDATIGHQLFDLKLTDRVNMRMVGVPESSLEMWANQFVAKGFKIARVDQIENALSKEMRERDEMANGGKKGKDDKVIKRELACVLTAGTLVDGSMLQDDMSTFCVAIKEDMIDDMPAYGISFVDTATGQFHLTQFVDDADLTRFETFVAQTRPQELLLEKGGVSVKTLRILKNNTSPTTIWNYLKPGREFWEGHITVKEIEASEYFPDAWPDVLEKAKEKELLMSSLGALIQYLRTLKIERDLITIGNFTWYDPIRKASSLVLDGQTLINLEVFANTYDGGPDGTLFQLLNRCITPFGKRLFKQWVCHPLVNTKKINARLDAIDSLNADTKVRDRFTSQMTRMPDLERLISRVHAGSCKAQDFLRVLEGFEQIDHTMSLLRDGGGRSSDSDSVISQLIAAMPELTSRLEYWMKAFDRQKAKEAGILVPERGIEEDFDESQDKIEAVHEELNDLLRKWRKELGSSAICYRDNGKEIFQMEVPIKASSKVPKHWDQMSATKQCKRYYFPELRRLVRKLQEAQEMHSQIVREVASRFYARFDEHYDIWLAAVRIIAQLDCLISLAKASMSLGQPACRPQFVDDERSVLELIDLRHPCLVDAIDDFIPNDITLGGSGTPNISLLTGANAAGKSTVLRMTCIAVIMAQVGCYLPCASARLTPCDRIMSRLGAQDHIFAAQSTFFVELAETKKILTEATPRSLVILDELGRGTSSRDGLAVAGAVLHHLASHVGCVGFFATHYHALAGEFDGHPEVRAQRMKILVDERERRVTFLYKLEEGVAEGSFGMHVASMCGINNAVVEAAERAAEAWEHTTRAGRVYVKKESLTENERGDDALPLGLMSDVAALLREEDLGEGELDALLGSIERL